jgi:hypothetical protein
LVAGYAASNSAAVKGIVSSGCEHDVSRRVNNPKNEGAECIEAIA